MDTEANPQRGDRLKFLVAIMTKDYSNAIDMGISILKREPNDYHVRNCISALKKITKSDKAAEMQVKSLPDQEANISSSGTEDSDETGSSTDESVDDTDDETCTRVIGATEVHSGAGKSTNPKSIKDCISEVISARSGITDGKLFNFREKMYRVLPLKFNRKK